MHVIDLVDVDGVGEVVTPFSETGLKSVRFFQTLACPVTLTRIRVLSIKSQ